MVSLLNRIDASGTAAYQYSGQINTYQSFQTSESRINSFSPLFRLGFTLFPEHLFSLQADIVYIGYANTSTSFGQTFDLGFSGVVYRTLLTVRL